MIFTLINKKEQKCSKDTNSKTFEDCFSQTNRSEKMVRKQKDTKPGMYMHPNVYKYP